MLKKIRSNWQVLLCIILYELIAFSIFLKPHYVHDTYLSYARGFDGREFLLLQGRVAMYWFDELFNFLGWSVSQVQLISVILSMLFLALAAFLVYLLINERAKIEKNVCAMLISIVVSIGIITTMYNVEWLLYVETAVTCCGVFASLLATYYLLEMKKIIKYLFATILFCLSVFCYQASIAIGGAVLTLFTIYDNKDSILTILKKLILNMIPYGIALISNLVYSKLINAGAGDYRVSGTVDILYNIKKTIQALGSSIVYTYGFLPKGLMLWLTLIVVFITINFLISNRKSIMEPIKIIAYMCFAYGSLIVLSVMPMQAMSSELIYFMPRSIPFIAATFTFTCLICLLFAENMFLKNKLIRVLVIGHFVLTTMLIINIQSQNMQNSTRDMLIGNIIHQNIINYENENGIEIDTIILLPDNRVEWTSPNIHAFSDATARAFLSDWSSSAIMQAITDRNFIFKTGTSGERYEIFADLPDDQTDFNINQLKFENNILYMLLY